MKQLEIRTFFFAFILRSAKQFVAPPPPLKKWEQPMDTHTAGYLWRPRIGVELGLGLDLIASIGLCQYWMTVYCQSKCHVPSVFNRSLSGKVVFRSLVWLKVNICHELSLCLMLFDALNTRTFNPKPSLIYKMTWGPFTLAKTKI